MLFAGFHREHRAELRARMAHDLFSISPQPNFS